MGCIVVYSVNHLGPLEFLIATKYLVGLLTTVFAAILTYWLGGKKSETTTRVGIVTVVFMNFNISLLFIQYSGDLERIKFVWMTVWVIFVVALVAAYKLGKGGFDVSKGKAASIVRRIGSPIISGVVVFFLYVTIDYFFEYLRPLLQAL